MPSSTRKQHNFMAALAHNPSFAKKVGIPQSVGKDFNEADKGRKFGRGGKINIQNTQHGKLDMPFKQLNRMAGMKGGGSVRKFARGDMVSEKDYKASGYSTLRDYLNNQRKLTRRDETPEQNTIIQSKARADRGEPAPSSNADSRDQQAAAAPSRSMDARDMKAKVAPSRYLDARDMKAAPPEAAADVAREKGVLSRYKKGGSVKESKGMMFMKKKGAPASMMGMKHGGMHKMPDGKMMKDSAMKKMNMGGMSKYAKGGGIESRGKTQGTIIKMATGGSVSSRADGIAQRGKTKFKNY